MAQEQASVTITLTDEISAPLQRIQEQFEHLSETMKAVGSDSRTGFREIQEQAKNAGENLKRTQELAGEAGKKIGRELGDGYKNLIVVLGQVTGATQIFNRSTIEIVDTVGRFVSSLGGLARGGAGAVGTFGALVAGVQLASRAFANAYQQAENFRQQVGTSQHQINIWRQAFEGLGKAGKDADSMLEQLTDEMRDLQRLGTQSPLAQHMIEAHGWTERTVSQLQKYKDIIDKTGDAEAAARERIKDISARSEAYRRQEADHYHTQVRVITDLNKKMVETAEIRSDPKVIQAEKDHERALKNIADQQEEYNKAMVQWEPTWLKIQTVVIKGLTDISAKMTEMAGKPFLPEIPDSWQKLMDFLFGKDKSSWGQLLKPSDTGYTSQQNILERLQNRQQGRQFGGGVSPGGMYTVGERGPELFTPSTHGNIVAANDMRDIPTTLKSIDDKQTTANAYLKDMRDALIWIRSETETATGKGAAGGLAGQLGIGSIGGGGGGGGGGAGAGIGAGAGGGGFGFGGTGPGGGGRGGGGVAGFGGGAGFGAAGGVQGLPGGPAGGQAVYSKMLEMFKNSAVVGKTAPQFGITTGSAEEWARFGTAVARAESNFNPRSTNTSDPGGSFGILQYAHGQVPGGNAYNVDASIAAFVRDAETSMRSGGLGRYSLLGRRFSTIGAHPERTIRNLATYGAGGDGGYTGGAPAAGGVDPGTSLGAGPAPGSGQRPFQYSGVVTLGGEQFHYGTGGGGKGSLPFGSYNVNIASEYGGRGQLGPIGRRIGSVATLGGLGGEVSDPRVGGRAGIQIHPSSSDQLDHLFTAGCFAIRRSEWPRFKQALLNEARKGPLFLNINRNGQASIGGRQLLPGSGHAVQAEERQYGPSGRVSPMADRVRNVYREADLARRQDSTYDDPDRGVSETIDAEERRLRREVQRLSPKDTAQGEAAARANEAAERPFWQLDPRHRQVPGRLQGAAQSRHEALSGEEAARNNEEAGRPFWQLGPEHRKGPGPRARRVPRTRAERLAQAKQDLEQLRADRAARSGRDDDDDGGAQVDPRTGRILGRRPARETQVDPRTGRETQDGQVRPPPMMEVKGSAKVEVHVKSDNGTSAKAKANGSGSLKDISVKHTQQMAKSDGGEE